MLGCLCVLSLLFRALAHLVGHAGLLYGFLALLVGDVLLLQGYHLHLLADASQHDRTLLLTLQFGELRLQFSYLAVG